MNMDNASFISPFEFSQLPNLTSYTLCVPHCRDEYFVTKDFLSIALHQSSLVSLSKLAEVYLDFCLNMTHLPAILGFLTAIPNLRRVGFGEPNGAFLVGVAAGLRNMHSIRELHISVRIIDAPNFNLYLMRWLSRYILPMASGHICCHCHRITLCAPILTQYHSPQVWAWIQAVPSRPFEVLTGFVTTRGPTGRISGIAT